MLFETPEDTYNAYKRFLKKKEYRKAYRCLEKILHEFPDDIELMEDIVDLCIFSWQKPEISKQWLIKLAKIRALWIDYMLLSRVEAELGNIKQAKEYLKKSKEMQKTQPRVRSKQEAKKTFSELEGFIKYKESDAFAILEVGSRSPFEKKEKQQQQE